jgi:hypothetical protein
LRGDIDARVTHVLQRVAPAQDHVVLQRVQQRLLGVLRVAIGSDGPRLRLLGHVLLLQRRVEVRVGRGGLGGVLAAHGSSLDDRARVVALALATGVGLAKARQLTQLRSASQVPPAR